MDPHYKTGGAADKSPPFVASSSKRPLTTVSHPDQPPAKKQQQDWPRPVDLDRLFIAYVSGTTQWHTMLNMLAQPGVTGGELRNVHHYSYIEFRRWLSEVARVPHERPLGIVLRGWNGEHRLRCICDRWSFAGLLGWVKNGICTLPCDRDGCYFLMFQPYDGPPQIPAFPIEFTDYKFEPEASHM